jgi:hypothetical protein
MDWILSHRAEADAIGRIGRLRLDRFDLDSVLKMHEQLYETAVGSNTGRRRVGVAC